MLRPRISQEGTIGGPYPDVSPEDYKAKLEETRIRLFDRACKIVEANASLIFDTTDFAFREVVKQEKGNRGGQIKKATVSKAAIDSFLQDKPISDVDP
jgi:hypothetical protein